MPEEKANTTSGAVPSRVLWQGHALGQLPRLPDVTRSGGAFGSFPGTPGPVSAWPQRFVAQCALALQRRHMHGHGFSSAVAAEHRALL